MSLSIDLDNKWSYLQTHGNDAWRDYPGYLPMVVPRILDFLAARDLHITFFVVGKDATLAENLEPLRRIREQGHDVGSHSFKHEPWLHLYSEVELEAELEQAERAIESATGVKVKGFRGPGFSLSSQTLAVLSRRGYRYDATAFPNALNPLARAYFLSRSQLSSQERKKRGALFGSFRDAFRPIKPYRWALPERTLLEIPVTTMPWFKVPIHFSYLLYLAGFSPMAMKLYLHTMITMCRLTRTEPSLLLHPLDFMGVEDDDDLGFFPAMDMPLDTKMAHMERIFATLLKHFAPCTMEQIADDPGNGRTLREFPPVFNSARS